MGQKKTNIKIKHHKYNLYNKKKNKAKQILTIILTIAAACVLGVVGYGIGKPLMNYFQNREQYIAESSSSDEISSIISEIISAQESSEVSSAESTTAVSSENSSDAEPTPTVNDKMYFLPDNAAESSDSLRSALAAAKNTGCNMAVITLKNEEGLMLYKSGLAILKEGNTIKASLTAQQISSMISEAGFIPAAKISTLKDKSSMSCVDGSYMIVGGGGWMDDYPEKGGKPWMSPFKNETISFIGSITEELSAAGFKNIICENTMYPAFHSIDITTYLSDLPLTDSTKRAAALWNVVDAAKKGAEKNGAELWLEMDGSALLGAEKLSTNAELALDANKLKNSKLIISYSPDKASTDAYSSAKSFASKVKTAAGGAEIAVSVNTLSGAAFESAAKAFSEADIKVFVTSSN